MKKIVVGLLAIALAVLLAGCARRNSLSNVSVTVYNSMTDMILYECGDCSFTNNGDELVITDNNGKINVIYLNDYITYVVEEN